MGSVVSMKATPTNPYPRTFEDVLDWFATEDDCAAYLKWVRWPDGFACPEMWRHEVLADGAGAVALPGL